METMPRQNFHTEVEAGINKQINMELYASYTYQSMVRLREILILFYLHIIYGHMIYGYSLVTMLHFHECLKISSELWAISVITNSIGIDIVVRKMTKD